ncbi:alpha/beta-hydrolase [Athelia psychrophila]|uniref:Alpha/beta-hydrolase n=1 Tax=Athelia psychrophila TaxID=1759441 RepID=A0A165WUD9_9AGAM|nr:alpha/beta-hydrolase [Fibularhizoctonia sp. CBS 109695]
MSQSPTTKWDTGEVSELVSVGTQKIFLTASGRSRAAGDPAVIIVAGLGDSGLGWAAVAREVAPFARIYRFDRPGLGRSPPSTQPRAADVMATELSDLLQAAGIEPPYVVVAHSYGGIIAREFLALRPNDVWGMVLVDTNTENSPQALYTELLNTMMDGVDYYAVAGYEANHRFTAEEWAEIKNPVSEDAATAGAEAKLAESGYAKLGEKRQYDTQALGDKPLSVIKGQTGRDCRKLYDAGLARGNGTEEQRRVLLRFLEGMDDADSKNQQEQLRLSSLTEFGECDSGHNIQITEPDVIAAGVQWVLSQQP